MIVWLASYPRSGNTLLRTVLCDTLGLRSFPEKTQWPTHLERKELTPQNKRIAAVSDFQQFPKEAWEDFYPVATDSDDLFLVKTHEAPMDDQPAIYVVRDGRNACESYYEFHRTIQPRLERTLAEVIIGDDYYGDWTSHYRAWNADREEKTLVVRFEDLVEASDDLVFRLGEFLHSDRDVKARAWKNRFEEFHEVFPQFYRSGRVNWEAPSYWTPEVEGLFYLAHGNLMKELGYSDIQSGKLSQDIVEKALCSLESPRVPYPSIALSDTEGIKKRLHEYGSNEWKD